VTHWAFKQTWPPVHWALVLHCGLASAVVMQNPPVPHTGPSLHAAQSSALVQLVRHTPFTHCSPPVQSRFTLHSYLAEWSGWQIRMPVVPAVMVAPHTFLLEEQVPLAVQSS
jgi:hypothetical protein